MGDEPRQAPFVVYEFREGGARRAMPSRDELVLVALLEEAVTAGMLLAKAVERREVLLRWRSLRYDSVDRLAWRLAAHRLGERSAPRRPSALPGCHLPVCGPLGSLDGPADVDGVRQVYRDARSRLAAACRATEARGVSGWYGDWQVCQAAIDVARYELPRTASSFKLYQHVARAGGVAVDGAR